MADDRQPDTADGPAQQTSPARPPETGPAGPPPRSRRRLDAALGRGFAGVLSTIVSVLTTAVVAVLAVHILFVVFEANTANEIVGTIADWADDLAWNFRDVFEPAEAKARIAVNYGLAALVYLILGRIVVNLIRRLG
jgi:hypothetical protein